VLYQKLLQDKNDINLLNGLGFSSDNAILYHQRKQNCMDCQPQSFNPDECKLKYFPSL